MMLEEGLRTWMLSLRKRDKTSREGSAIVFMCKWMITKNITLQDTLEFLLPLDSSIGTKKQTTLRQK